MGVAGEGVPTSLFHKTSTGEKARATKNGKLGWRLRVRDPKRKGKQPERSFYGSYKEAVRELTKMEETLNKGEMLALSKGPKTIKDAAEIWLEAYKWNGRISLSHTGEPNRPYSTWHKAKVQVNTYILPRLNPETRLSSLSKRDLEACLKDMAEQKYKASSINTTVSVMKSLFRDLHRLEITPTNYSSEISGNWVTSLEKSRESLKIPSEQEMLMLALALEDCWRGHGFIVQALSWTGLRFAELAALEWEDIDLNLQVIKVRRASTESGGRRSSSTSLKSKSSRRDIVLLEMAEEVFKDLNERRLENQKKYPQYNWDRLLNGSRGGYISYKTWRRHLQEARKISGIDLTAHDLRHIFASKLFDAGMSVQYISNQLGHSSTRITEATYIHLIERSRKEEAKLLNPKFWNQ